MMMIIIIKLNYLSDIIIMMMMMMTTTMTTTTKLKRKMGGKQCLRVFNGGKVKQSDRWEDIIIDGQENTKVCVKKTSWEDVEWRSIAQAGATGKLLLRW
jgi:hypothetical protein